MIIEAIATAKSIDEAKEKALESLCAPEDADVEFEIIDLPEKKTLGLFGGKDAKVRAFYDDGKKEPVKKSQKAQKPQTKPVEKTEKAEKVEKVEKVKKSAKGERPNVKADKTSAENSAKYLKSILDNMALGEAEVELVDIEDGFCLNISGCDIGNVIGHRGETLDALQYLVSLNYNNDKDGFVRVVVDCNNYRQKRENTLTELAQRIAAQATQDRRCQSLEPMNPYERRIIHTAVQGFEGISSWSVSDGKYRRVIIGPKEMEGKNVPRHEKRNNRNGGYRRNKSEKASTPSAAREKLSDSADLPLFGRIN